MRIICPKIFAKLDLLVLVKLRNGCCMFCTENILSIFDIFTIFPCLHS